MNGAFAAIATETASPAMEALCAQGWAAAPCDGAGWLAARAGRDLWLGETVAAAGIAALDDRTGLRALLGGSPQADASDIALIGMARAALGPDFVTRLSGAFACVIWDRRARRFEAYRDHFGEAPLFFGRGTPVTGFSSEPRLAAALSEARLEINELCVSGHLAGLVDDPTATAFTDLARLPPAHGLTLIEGAPVTRAYWRLAAPAPFEGGDPVDEMRALFAAAVRARLAPPETGRVGAMLSGGLDSSAIAAAAAAARRAGGEPPLDVFSIVYPAGAAEDERPWIEATAAHCGLRTHFIEMTEADRMIASDAFIDAQFDLFAAPGAAKSQRLLATAAAAGVTALLDGHGGDEVVSQGYGRLTELAAAGAWATLIREARGVGRLNGASWMRLTLDEASRRAAFGGGRTAARILRRLGVLLGGGPAPGSSLRLVLEPDFSRRTALPERFRAEQARFTPTDPRRAATHRHEVELAAPMMAQGFEVLRRSAAIHGVTPRYPFFDRRLVMFCLSLPAERKLAGGWGRRIMRDAMEGALPDRVCWRIEKTRFNGELARSLIGYGEGSPEARAARMSAGLEPYLDRAAFAEAYARMTADPEGTDGRILFFLWRATLLGQWLRRLPDWRAALARPAETRW